MKLKHKRHQKWIIEAITAIGHPTDSMAIRVWMHDNIKNYYKHALSGNSIGQTMKKMPELEVIDFRYVRCSMGVQKHEEFGGATYAIWSLREWGFDASWLP